MYNIIDKEYRKMKQLEEEEIQKTIEKDLPLTNYINKIKKGELSMEHKMKALNTHCKNKYEKILREKNNAKYVKHSRMPI